MKPKIEKETFRRGNLFVYVYVEHLEVYADAQKGHGESDWVCCCHKDDVDRLIAALTATKHTKTRG